MQNISQSVNIIEYFYSIDGNYYNDGLTGSGFNPIIQRIQSSEESDIYIFSYSLDNLNIFLNFTINYESVNVNGNDSIINIQYTNATINNESVVFGLAYQNNDLIVSNLLFSPYEKHNNTFRGTITPLTLEGTFTNINKIYDGNTNVNPLFTFTPTNLISGDTLTITYTTEYNSKNVADANTINIEGTSYNQNYLFNISSTPGTIRPLTLEGTFTNINKIYDGNTNVNPLFTFTPTNLIGSDTTDIINLSGQYNSKNVAEDNTININSSSSNTNYLFNITSTPGTITPLTLEGTFTNINKIYDGNTNVNPLFTFTPTNLIGSDTTDIINLSGQYNSKNVAEDNTININGSSSNTNYSLPQTTFGSITQAILTPIFTSIPKIYDQKTNANVIYTLNGLILGDIILLSYNANYLTPDTGTNKQIDITNISINPNTYSNNYELVYTSTEIYDGVIILSNLSNLSNFINKYTNINDFKKINVININNNAYGVLYIQNKIFAPILY
jgi:hypothetical protein